MVLEDLDVGGGDDVEQSVAILAAGRDAHFRSCSLKAVSTHTCLNMYTYTHPAKHMYLHAIT